MTQMIRLAQSTAVQNPARPAGSAVTSLFARGLSDGRRGSRLPSGVAPGLALP